MLQDPRELESNDDWNEFHSAQKSWLERICAVLGVRLGLSNDEIMV